MKQEASLIVALRVRPMNHSEFKSGAKITAHAVDNNMVVVLDPSADPDDILRANRSREKHYIFDHAFDQMAKQNDVYENTTKNLVSEVLSGYNVTVFAYGPTGAGKTYTMLGTTHDPGIMVLTLNDLFKQMKSKEEDVIYKVTMSYMEIYNEMIRDLLYPNSGILELRDDTNGDTVVAGISEVEATSTIQVMELLSRGNLRRTCEPTAANRTSSRSHAILKVMVQSRSRVMDISQEVHTGCLFMVDLAGSERAAVTKNRGQRMVEGAHINRSLLALGNCINALATTGTGKHVNYRDSKLTRILKESLSGNAKTVMIAHISPASSSFEESRNTLGYAERSTRIKTRIHQNVYETQYHVLQYHEIIRQLRYKISKLQEKVACCQCSANQDFSAIDELCQKLTQLFAEQKDLREAICSLKYRLVQNAIDTQKPLSVIAEWKMRDIPTIFDTPSHSTQVKEEDNSVKSCDNNTTSHVLPVPESSQETETNDEATCNSQEFTTSGLIDIEHIRYNTGMSEDEMMEPPEISEARGELATLVGEKQRMEARERRLERRLSESENQLAELQVKLSKIIQIPLQYQQYLQHSCVHHELQTSTLDYGLAAAIGSLKITQQESTMTKLQKQCSLSLQIFDKQWALMKEHSLEIPKPLQNELKQLRIKHSLLSAEIQANHQLVARTTSELPNIGCYSARNDFTLAQGSKSNFLEEDEGKETVDSEESDVHLPNIINGPLVMTGWESASTLLPQKLAINQEIGTTEAISEPIVCSPTNIGSSTKITQNKSLNHKSKSLPRSFNSVPSVNLSQHKQTAKRNRPILTKVTSFTNPQISISRCSSHRSRAKYMIPVKPVKRDKPLDIESVKTSSVTSLSTSKSHSYLPNSKHHSTVKKSPYRRSTLPEIRQPKLSQATQNRLREARTVVTVNDLPQQVERLHHRTSQHIKLTQPPQKRKVVNQSGRKINNNTPRRQPHTKHTKSVLIPHKVIAGDSRTVKFSSSPYQTTPVKTKLNKPNPRNPVSKHSQQNKGKGGTVQ